MARISTYNIDQDVRADDKFIGTDSNGIITKNFTPSGIANFLNTTGAIAIAGQNNFFFQTDLAGGRKAGTISFTNGDGEDTPFSVLTTLKISKYASSTIMVLDYLQTLVGQAVFIGQTDNLNNFGIYKLLSLDQDLLEPNFYNAVFQEIESHGALLSEKYYALAVYPYTQELVPTSRTLTINGTTYDLSANRTWNVGTVTEVGATGLLTSSAGTTPIISTSIATNRLVGRSTAGTGIMEEITIGTGLTLSAGTLSNTNSGTVTSVGLTMPAAFNVANSPITSDGTLAVTALGTASQYIRGDGQLAAFPSTGGGGSSVNYYLNGSISSSDVGYQQMDNEAIIGSGTDFTLVGNGLIAQFLTDVGNPNRIEIPGGAWNSEIWFSMSSSGGAAKFYIDLLKYDGSTFTLISTGVTNPEDITGGTSTDLYLTSLAVPTTTLLATDRLAIRIYIVDNSGGRTATLHTENSNLCEIITTFSGGVTSLNGLTANTQYLAVGTTGTDFNISSLGDTHTFNIPNAGVGVSRGLITDLVQSIEGAKTFIKDLRVNTLTIGKGGGNRAQNTAVGFQALLSNTTGNNNTANGYQPLYSNTIGEYNIAIGHQPLYYNTTGGSNIAIGALALNQNTTGTTNVATGVNALSKNTTGSYNTANGDAALYNNTTGIQNVAIGRAALFSSVAVSNNIAIGHNALQFSTATLAVNSAVGAEALKNNTEGFANTAMGYQALFSNTTGWVNTAMGNLALYANTTGTDNVALGSTSLYGNTTGNQNTAVGTASLRGNTTGIDNVGIGYQTMYQTNTGNNNVAVGHTSLTNNLSGTSNVAVGSRTLLFNTSGNNNTALGYRAAWRNTTASGNTAIGYESLFNNTTGAQNVTVGTNALRANTTGTLNTAIGADSLYSNTIGLCNTALGTYALATNTVGNFSTAVGYQALRNNTAAKNTAIGVETMFSNMVGTFNTVVGQEALRASTAGSYNSILGNFAILNAEASYVSALGRDAGRFSSAADLLTASESIFIGFNSKSLNTTSTNEIVIGANAVGEGDNTTTIGHTTITSTRLRGAVKGGSFVKDGGTAAQYLMADGSITTVPYRYNFGGSIPLTGTLVTTNLLTITIPANSLTDYLDIRSIMVQQSGTILGGMQVRIWHNSVNNFNTATRILNYAFGAGSADLYAQISRRFSLQSGLMFGFPSTPSNSQGTIASTGTPLSIPFDPAVTNYLFVSIQLNDVTDTAILRNVNITT